MLDFYSNLCILALKDGVKINRGSLNTVQLMMRPRRCIEQERVAGVPTEKGLLVTLIFVLKDTKGLATAIKRNAFGARKLAKEGKHTAECCTDPVVAVCFARAPETRLASFKDGYLEKLGEGGLRGKLLKKKWQVS